MTLKHFRESMQWLHTWAGLALGTVLFAMFWMGTLSVFDSEIDRWMNPASRIVLPEALAVDYDALRPRLEDLADEGARTALIVPPAERQPLLILRHSDSDGERHLEYFNPLTMEALPDSISLGGSGFIFPFHFRLHLSWMGIGYWLVGLASMAMLALLVSGLFIHRKLIAEFFVLRPKKRSGRLLLDIHNASSLVALPFHFLLPLTGLYIFFGVYFPWAIEQIVGEETTAVSEEAFGFVLRERADERVPMLDLNALISETEARWQARSGAGDRVDSIRMFNPGDRQGTITLAQIFAGDRVEMYGEVSVYDAGTGELINEHSHGAVRDVHAWLAALHFVQFDSWLLRWLYFVAGLLGCVMIATGFLFWVSARERRLPGQARFVDAMAAGSTLGMVLATAAFFLINRVLPVDAAFLGQDRPTLEVWAFFLVWVGSFGLAATRARAAWRDLCWLITGTAGLAALLNQLTTGDGILSSLEAGLYAVAGMDLLLLAAATISAIAAIYLGDRAVETSVRPATA
ncbi:MAG: PepSY-associated TM helix domain-containing protein [Pseudomonadota bacterium]